MKIKPTSRLKALILVLILLLSNTSTATASNDTASNDTISNAIANATTLSTEQQEIDIHHYYYNLNELEKTVYDTFTKFKAKILSNQKFTFRLGPITKKETYVYSVSRARQAFILDDPEALIWFQNVELSLHLKDSDAYVLVQPQDSTNRYSDLSSKELPNAIKTFEEKASQIAKTLHGTDREKLYQIYSWLLENVTYDFTFELPNTRSAYGALINGKSVCSGFAYAYKYIADLAGLEVLYVTGILNSASEYHAWNMAKVDGKWYFIDATSGATNLRIFRGCYFLMSTSSRNYSLDTDFFTYPS